MKKKRLRHFSIYNETYKINLLIVGECTRDELLAFLKKEYNTNLYDYYSDISLQEGAYFQTENRLPYSIIWVKNLNRGSQAVAALTHEIFHHVLRACAKRQIPTYPFIDNLSMDEPAAYMLEFYVKKSLDAIKKI